MRSHEWIDQRSLALDRLVAEKVRANPALLERAVSTLARWIEQRQPNVPPVLREWQTVFATLPLEGILQVLTSAEQRAQRLRQSSPFCGILTPQERLAVLREYEARRT